MELPLVSLMPAHAACAWAWVTFDQGSVPALAQARVDCEPGETPVASGRDASYA